jgi:hypothetical protein
MVTSDEEVTSDEDEDPQQQEPHPVGMICQYKKQTSMRSYFAVPVKKRGCGRPKKVPAVSRVKIMGNKVHHQEEAPPAPVKKRCLKVNWSSDYNWPAICEALETRRAERDLPAADKDSQLSIEAGCIPCTTLNSVQQSLGDLPITRENCFANLGLLHPNDRQLLQDMIVNRDRMNTGMDRKECAFRISAR